MTDLRAGELTTLEMKYLGGGNIGAHCSTLNILHVLKFSALKFSALRLVQLMESL
jgi:hypothetical protein